MPRASLSAVVAAVLALAVPAAPAGAAGGKCPPDSVQVGRACVDKYEASIWEIPASNRRLVKKVLNGKVAGAAELSEATQRGASGDDYGPGCPDDAATTCPGLYPVSIPGVIPSQYLTWFQAAAACANVGKRLPTNQEWTLAALGTPDAGGADDDATTCNTGGAAAVATGSRSACVSTRGAFDMGGNVWERVAEWTIGGDSCATWIGFSDDMMCLLGAATNSLSPTGFVRGASYGYGTEAGPLAIGTLTVVYAGESYGFRCARDL